MRVPKPLRWGVVGAWLTLAIFRPSAALVIFLCVLSGVACCALLGAYLLAPMNDPPEHCLGWYWESALTVLAAEGAHWSEQVRTLSGEAPSAAASHLQRAQSSHRRAA